MMQSHPLIQVTSCCGNIFANQLLVLEKIRKQIIIVTVMYWLWCLFSEVVCRLTISLMASLLSILSNSQSLTAVHSLVIHLSCVSWSKEVWCRKISKLWVSSLMWNVHLVLFELRCRMLLQVREFCRGLGVVFYALEFKQHSKFSSHCFHRFSVLCPSSIKLSGWNSGTCNDHTFINVNKSLKTLTLILRLQE